MGLVWKYTCKACGNDVEVGLGGRRLQLGDTTELVCPICGKSSSEAVDTIVKGPWKKTGVQEEPKVAKVKTGGSTHIAVILDRTGSMESMRDDTIGGFNTFLVEQQKLPGQATMTLVQFDSQDPYEVLQRFEDILCVPQLTRDTYVPRGQTPLLDAMGRGINDAEKCIVDLPDADKPAKVVFVVITDGQENASREFTKAQIEKMIQEKQAANWQFVFLSADLNAVGDAMSMGVAAASTMSYDNTARGIDAAYRSTSRNVAAFRSGMCATASYDEDDRDQQESETKRGMGPDGWAK